MCESTGVRESGGCEGEEEGGCEGERAAGAEEAAAALTGALAARGSSEVLVHLVCGAVDADLALAIAGALRVAPERGCAHADKRAFLAQPPLRAAVLAQLVARRDVPTCARVARRLGLEFELAGSPRLAQMVKQRLLQVVEQMGDTEPRARPLLIAAALEGNQWGAVCWGARPFQNI